MSVPGLGSIGKDLGEIAAGFKDLASGNIAGGIGDLTKGIQGLENQEGHGKHHRCDNQGNNPFQQVMSELESLGIG